MSISLRDYITASGRYPERLQSLELTEEVKQEAINLLDAVNALLAKIGITAVTVSSGFRPSSVNAKIKGAATKSMHTLGRAVDLADADGAIAAKIQANPAELARFGLWLEDPASTKGWVHLDNKIRSARAVNIFKP